MTSLAKVAIVGLCLAAAACGPGDEDDVQDCAGEFLTGDLIITELFADPAGTDGGLEWFEIYNATGSPADLTGVVLVASREDMTDEDTHRFGEVIIDPSDHFVVGDADPMFEPSHVDYGYAGDLSLRNAGGRIAIRCGQREVDAVIYTQTASGMSRTFDGGQAPNHTANDILTNWCDASTEFETGSTGTPGAANEVCPGLATTCNDGGTDRELVVPVVGDLVINEVLPDPTGTDGVKEWFEVYVTKDVDLNGLQFGDTIGSPDVTLDDTDCLRVTAGSYIVFGRSTDVLLNGGLTQVDFLFDFSLTNTSDDLFLAHKDVVLDSISWSSSPGGDSISLDPGKQNVTDNDDEANFCDATVPYGDGDNNGSPGAANETCPIVVPPGMCNDGGTLRNLVPPLAADVQITEFLSDPGSTGGDAQREWFEVLFAADADINGLQMGKAFTPGLTVLETVPHGDCVRVTAGTYAIFAHTAVAGDNGNLPFVTALFGFSLNQDNNGIFVAYDNALLDGYAYGTTQDGTALSKDSGDTWCDAVTAWSPGAPPLGDLGTPGMANPTCVP